MTSSRSELAHDHCEHCRMSRPEPSGERNLELEAFIDGWAREHGYVVQWPAERDGKRTTLRLNDEGSASAEPSSPALRSQAEGT